MVEEAAKITDKQHRQLVEKLRADIDSRDADIANAYATKQRNAELQGEIDSLTSQLHASEEAVAASQRMRENARTDNNVLQRQTDTLKEELHQMKERHARELLDGSSVREDELQQQLHEKDLDLANLQEKIRTLSAGDAMAQKLLQIEKQLVEQAEKNYGLYTRLEEERGSHQHAKVT